MEKPDIKRQLAGRRTAELEIPFLPAQQEAVAVTVRHLQDAVNELLVENLAGETGPVGFPSRVWFKVEVNPATAKAYVTLVMERHLLNDTPKIVEAREGDLSSLKAGARMT